VDDFGDRFAGNRVVMIANAFDVGWHLNCPLALLNALGRASDVIKRYQRCSAMFEAQPIERRTVDANRLLIIRAVVNLELYFGFGGCVVGGDDRHWIGFRGGGQWQYVILQFRILTQRPIHDPLQHTHNMRRSLSTFSTYPRNVPLPILANTLWPLYFFTN